MKPGYAFDGHIVGLGRSRREDNVFGVRPNKICNVLNQI